MFNILTHLMYNVLLNDDSLLIIKTQRKKPGDVNSSRTFNGVTSYSEIHDPNHFR